MCFYNFKKRSGTNYFTQQIIHSYRKTLDNKNLLTDL